MDGYTILSIGPRLALVALLSSTIGCGWSRGEELRRESGVRARPLSLDSDTSIQAFVASHPGAIGYVSGGALLIKGVKEVGVVPER